MTLLPTLLILVFATLMVGGIWLARYSSLKQQEALERRQRARALKQRIDELAEISGVLLRYDGNPNLMHALTEFRIREIQRRLETLQEADSDGELQTAQAFLDNLTETLAERRPLLPTTDHDINHMKRYLFKAIKLVKRIQSNGYLLESDGQDHARRLRLLVLKTEVNAYIQQARQLLKDEDRISAASHFKHAKELLVASNLSFPERSSMIKRISKMIWGIYSTQQDEDALDAELGLTSADSDQVDWGLAEPDDAAMADVEDVSREQMRKQVHATNKESARTAAHADAQKSNHDKRQDSAKTEPQQKTAAR